MRAIRRLLRENHGTTAVEFALFLPFFLMLVFGTVELGGAWYQQQMLVNASREGARLGSMMNDTSNTASQVRSTVTQYLQQAGFPGSVTVTSTGTDGSAGDSVQVTVSSTYRLPSLAGLIPGVPATVTLKGVTVMRHE